jgi:hypothetical protein
VHGDFRFQSVKNLSSDLLNNDLEIQKAFLAAATRFGAIVAGYSGRDKNVMGARFSERSCLFHTLGRDKLRRFACQCR